MQGRIKVLKDVDKSNILPMTHAKAVYVDEKNTLDEALNNIESQITQQTKTYAELKELIENNKLIPGVQYVLKDYRTKYRQPTTNVIKEMEVEELILTASSKNTFEPIVFSTKFPSDTIWYDFDNNVCEDNLTARKGFILRRYDPISKNDAPQDWRTMLWARYKPHPTQYLKDGALTNYRTWTVGSTGALNQVYKAYGKFWMAKNNNTVATSSTDPNVFYEVYPDLAIPLLITEKTKISKDVELMRGDLVEVKTFGDGCINNIIETRINNTLHNNTIIENCNNNTFGKGCIHNTLYGGSNNNTFGSSCSINIISNNCHYNCFGSICTSNYLQYACNKNSFANDCYNNSFGNSCRENTFGNNCYSNSFSDNCYNNSFGNNCYSNSFGTNCYNNSFGNSCYNNEFGYTFLSNSFDNECHTNVFGSNCRYNHIGANFNNNTCGYTFQANNFGNGCNFNTFGESCVGNTFFNFCSENTFGNNFKHNVIKKLQSKNVSNTQGQLTASNTVVTIEQRGTSEYVQWYLTTSGISQFVIP